VFNNADDGIFVSGGCSNVVQNNSIFSNTGDGLDVCYSDNNCLWHNETTNNGVLTNGVKTGDGVNVVGGTGNDIWVSTSSSNFVDGISLTDTHCTTVVGNTLGSNGGYGLRLSNADNTFIALNLIQNNAEGSIYIDAASDNVTTVANRTDDPITREEV